MTTQTLHVGKRTITDIQNRHVRTVQGYNRDEVCGHCGLAWPCDVAQVFASWDADGTRQIAVTKSIYRDVATRLIRDLTPNNLRLKRKADHPDSSYDPLVRESAVIAILAAFAEPAK